jgi:hypothetical protein
MTKPGRNGEATARLMTAPDRVGELPLWEVRCELLGDGLSEIELLQGEVLGNVLGDVQGDVLGEVLGDI